MSRIVFTKDFFKVLLMEAKQSDKKHSVAFKKYEKCLYKIARKKDMFLRTYQKKRSACTSIKGTRNT